LKPEQGLAGPGQVPRVPHEGEDAVLVGEPAPDGPVERVFVLTLETSPSPSQWCRAL
jgi:hypothetical protein